MARTKIPQLYIKNKKGKYEKYSLPENDIEDTVYYKVNGKYIPMGKSWDREFLTEGIWAVTSRPGVKSMTNGSYIKDCFSIDKVSDIGKIPSMADLAAWYKSVEDICRTEAVQSMWDKPHSLMDVVTTVMGEIFKDVALKDKGEAGDINFTPYEYELEYLKYHAKKGSVMLVRMLEGDTVGFHLLENRGTEEDEWYFDGKPFNTVNTDVKVNGYIKLK